LNCAHQGVVQEVVLGKPNLCIQPHMCPRALQTAPCTLCPEKSVQIQLEKDEPATMVKCSDSGKITKRKPRLRFVCLEIFFGVFQGVCGPGASHALLPLIFLSIRVQCLSFFSLRLCTPLFVCMDGRSEASWVGASPTFFNHSPAVWPWLGTYLDYYETHHRMDRTRPPRTAHRGEGHILESPAPVVFQESIKPFSLALPSFC